MGRRGGSTEWESSHDGVLLVLGEEIGVPGGIPYVKLERGSCLLLLLKGMYLCLLHHHVLVCEGHVWIKVGLLLGDCEAWVLLEKGVEAGIKGGCVW